MDLSITPILVFTFGGVATAYGYVRWKKYNYRPELLWSYAGLYAMAVGLFEFVVPHLIHLTPDQRSIFLSAKIIADTLMIGAWIYVGVRLELWKR